MVENPVDARLGCVRAESGPCRWFDRNWSNRGWVYAGESVAARHDNLMNLWVIGNDRFRRRLVDAHSSLLRSLDILGPINRVEPQCVDTFGLDLNRTSHRSRPGAVQVGLRSRDS